MRRKRLIWQVYPAFVCVTFLALAATVWYMLRAARDMHLQQTSRDLETKAAVVGKRLASAPQPPTAAAVVDPICKEFGSLLSTRLTVILSSGKVVGDSERSPSSMEDHSDRPEFIVAMRTGRGESIRYSNTLKRQMMYVGLPLEWQGQTIGVIRASLPLRTINEMLRDTYTRILVAGVLVMAVAAAFSLILTRHIAYPLESLRRGTERFAAGELDFRLALPNSEELASLATAMNEMASQLRDRVRTVTEQRNERDAVFASMIEGVVAVDLQERLLQANEAAEELLGFSADESEGRKLEEIVRNSTLHDMIRRVLGGESPVACEFTIHGEEDCVVSTHCTALTSATGEGIGALVVLQDVTQLRRLESVRRDFVANVSHELKTPITTIKGFVETLMDGAKEDPQVRDRFLQIMSRQVERMHAIIEDLLSLSRLEHREGKSTLLFEATRLLPVLKEAAEICSARADKKSINLNVQCPEDLTVEINTPLLEQALVNLIDNATKYGPADSRVDVTAVEQDGGVRIDVRDFGPGIPAGHVDRIFERFYRIDKGRSRELGGTGLGLAIVKHICLTHRGNVTVESRPGVETVFHVHLPIRQPDGEQPGDHEAQDASSTA